MTTEERTAVTRTPTMTELFTRAKENLKQTRGIERALPPDPPNYRASAQANRELLDSIFMEPRWLDPVETDTGTTLFGAKMKVPVFCSALSKPANAPDDEMLDIVRGLGKSGSMMMLGMSGSEILQASIDTGTPVVKIVKPFRNLDLVYEQVKEAEQRGCVATGMDIDYSYGSFRDGAGRMTDTFSPKTSAELRQVISSSGLPFIVKGVLSVRDAEKAVEMGAAAIIVSNHMWSSFDFGVPVVAALPKIVKAVGNKLTVFADSGFRTGNDVFKAFALGARGIGLTTSIVMAAGAGADGVAQYLGFVQGELKRTMAITGCPDLASINSSLLSTTPKVTPWW